MAKLSVTSLSSQLGPWAQEVLHPSLPYPLPSPLLLLHILVALILLSSFPQVGGGGTSSTRKWLP